MIDLDLDLALSYDRPRSRSRKYDYINFVDLVWTSFGCDGIPHDATHKSNPFPNLIPIP